MLSWLSIAWFFLVVMACPNRGSQPGYAGLHEVAYVVRYGAAFSRMHIFPLTLHDQILDHLFLFSLPLYIPPSLSGSIQSPRNSV